MSDTMLKCKRCKKEYTLKIIDKVYGKYVAFRGIYCSPQCYTNSIMGNK